MASNKGKKVAAACKKMKEFGMSKEKVEAALKELLKVYCNNWTFIEDDNYRVLMDAVLESKQGDDKVTECERKTGSNSKINEVKSGKEGQIHDPLICELQKKRLRPRDQKGKAVIPVRNSRTHMSETSLVQEKDQDELSTGSQTSCEEDCEHLFKRNSSRDKKQTVVYEDSINHGDRFCSWPAENPLRVQEDGLSSCEDCEPQRKRPRANDDKDFLCYQSLGKEPLISEFSFGKKQSNPCNSQISTENILDFYHNDSLVFPSGEAFNDDLPLDEVPLKFRQPAVLTGNSSDVMEEETGFLHCEHLNVDDKGSRVSSTSQFDIASSSKGKVKVSLICNPSQSDFHVPSLEAVLEAVDEKYKLHRTLDLDFSVMKLMRDVCECFLTMASPSSVDKGLWIDDMCLSKRSDGANDSGNNFDNHLSNSNYFAIFQNLFKIVPHIPNIIELSGLEGLHYICGFKIPDVVDTHSHRERIKVLDVTQFTNSCAVADIEKDSFFSVVKCCYIDDITRGEEKVKISLENSFCAEGLPTFFYIQQNLVYNKAQVKFALSRISDEECCSHCFGDCLALPLPCACSHVTGGEYAYTQEGLLKEKFLEECVSLVQEPKEHNFVYCKRCPVEMSENKHEVKPCKGHLLRKFIKECWSRCGCNKNCGNRVVQRGITANLQVFWTPEGKGWGLRTLEDLPKGAFVCEYVGEVVTVTELHERIVQSSGKEKHKYTVLLDADWFSGNILKDEEVLCLDATLYGNVSRFINHRCADASLIEIPLEVETPDHHYYHLAFFTRRKVAAMEELTWDYGIDFNDKDHPMNAFRCLCDSPLCRDRGQ